MCAFACSQQQNSKSLVANDKLVADAAAAAADADTATTTATVTATADTAAAVTVTAAAVIAEPTAEPPAVVAA